MVIQKFTKIISILVKKVNFILDLVHVLQFLFSPAALAHEMEYGL